MMDSSAPFPTSDNNTVWPRRAAKVCGKRAVTCLAQVTDVRVVCRNRRVRAAGDYLAVVLSFLNHFLICHLPGAIKYDVMVTGECGRRSQNIEADS